MDRLQNVHSWIEIDGELIQQLDLDHFTATIRIPIRYVLSTESIQEYRQQSLDVIEKLGVWRCRRTVKTSLRS